MICEDCRWWKRMEDPPVESRSRGNCHKRSPQVMDRSRGYLIDRFPVTYFDDFCSELEDAEENK